MVRKANLRGNLPTQCIPLHKASTAASLWINLHLNLRKKYFVRLGNCLLELHTQSLLNRSSYLRIRNVGGLG